MTSICLFSYATNWSQTLNCVFEMLVLAEYLLAFSFNSYFLNICIVSLLHLQFLLLVLGLQNFDLHLSLETHS